MLYRKEYKPQNHDKDVTLFTKYRILIIIAALLFLWYVVDLDTVSHVGRCLSATGQLAWSWRGQGPMQWENQWKCNSNSDSNSDGDGTGWAAVIKTMKQSMDPWRSKSQRFDRRMVRQVYNQWRPFGGEPASSFPQLILVRIIDRELYLGFARYKGQDCYRVDGIARALSDVLFYCKKNFEEVPNVEFIVNISDSPILRTADEDTEDDSEEKTKRWGGVGKMPLIFSTTATSDYKDVLIPYPNSDPAVYRTLLSRVGVPWNARTDKLFWRGSPTDGNSHYEVGSWRSKPRAVLVGMSEEEGSKNLIDAKFTSYIQVSVDAVKEMSVIPAYKLAPRVPLGLVSAVKYAADMDGNTFTERTPSLMAQGSTVFLQASPWRVFYSPMIRPWVHYIPLLRNMSDAPQRVLWARANDKAARQIGENGREMVRNRLNRPSTACYWWTVLKEYAEVMDMSMSDSDSDSGNGDNDSIKWTHVPSGTLFRSGWMREICDAECADIV